MKFLAPFALLTVASCMASCRCWPPKKLPELTGCAAKRQAISAQIEQAKAHGNSDQQAGLEKALSEVTANCTDAALNKERENKVLDAKHEVSRRQADLDKAMKKGDADKINKRKDKLASPQRVAGRSGRAR